MPYIWLICRQIRGTTRTSEKGASPQTVNIVYMLPLEQISISGSNREANYTMIMAIDKQESNAKYSSRIFVFIQALHSITPKILFACLHLQNSYTLKHNCIQAVRGLKHRLLFYLNSRLEQIEIWYPNLLMYSGQILILKPEKH